ncbi:KTSC domain-containing protein [Mucilaginibacter sp. SJ]|uniref:KTSC domain-containing protein n=1 Tax=Mucilaginibacter sp. SJ TaxID=3029053 RepID=UPI0023AA14C4|nr:KTSC domain-containing protein [Mucilaginibacter sp. SJ]WEA01526.1 KTSC domain-containing protein [Mucilaginibacter sp. SJ]
MLLTLNGRGNISKTTPKKKARILGFNVMPSTVIQNMDYDLETQVLKISYVSGQTYLYKNVPEKVYKELKSSRVKGRYLHFFVKNKYEFEQISTG